MIELHEGNKEPYRRAPHSAKTTARDKSSP